MTFSGPWTRAIGRVSNGLSNWPLTIATGFWMSDAGSGTTTILAAAMAKEVVGIDLSPDMIELAEEKVQKECLKNTRLMASVEDSTRTIIRQGHKFLHDPSRKARFAAGNLFMHVQVSQTRRRSGIVRVPGRSMRCVPSTARKLRRI